MISQPSATHPKGESAIKKQPVSNEAEAVRAAADEFYMALNTLFTGELGATKSMWSHEADVTYETSRWLSCRLGTGTG